ncbi:MAG: cytidine deaminase [Candidatus Heimdallarchaeota archaeon]|nr:cytidine deaminase [Candidatus Heimdallarchaeota archaeon]
MKVELYLPKLIEQARKISKKAYAPYSNFLVGAAFLTTKEKIFTGCNVEFADYLALHAEVNAIGAAVNEGDTDIQLVVVYSYSSPPVLPCGSCRQKLYEFSQLHGHDIRVIAVNDKEEKIDMMLSKLLPGGEIKVKRKS